MNNSRLPASVLADLRTACADSEVVERVLAVVEPLLEEAERRNLELQRNQATLQSLVDNFPGGIVSVLDVEMRHLFVGGETVPHLGFDIPKMIGKTPSQYKPGEPADALEANIQRAMHGEPVRSLEIDGHMSTLVITTPIYDSAGELVGTIVVGQDVTDLVYLQEAKFEEERARHHLEQEVAASRARASIIEQVLHEVLNPLASLSSSAEILQNYGERISVEKRADHLQRIFDETQRLASTLSQLAAIND